MRCGKCGSDNREGRKFCAKCAAPLARSCPQCGASNEPGEDFCGECAAPLGRPPAALPKRSSSALIQIADEPAPESLEGERKTITALFADIKSSMELIETLDPEEARAIVDPALKLMIDAVHNYDGYVAQTTGEGIFALFGAPLAHEDDPQRALHAALRMLEDLQHHFAKIKESGQAAIEARVGVHTGEVVVRSLQTAEGRVEYVPVGHSIGLAARMQALARPGSIGVTDATRKLCEGHFNFRSLGPTKVKGVSETIDLYEVIGLGPPRTRLQRSAARGLTRFVGRDDEMRTLWNRWEAAREGDGQMVLIAGEAGIGKSRVILQFHERLSGTSHRWVEGAAEPYFRNTPFHAVVAMVKQALGLNGDLTPDECLDRLEGVLKRNGINPSDSAAPIAQVLNLPVGRYPESTLSPERARKRLLATLAKGLFALAASQPMVLALEDLHWADASTLEFLELLVEQAATAPVMILLTTRPEFEAPWPNRAHHTHITVGRLRDHEVREMVSDVAAKTVLTTQAFEAVRSRASGVPLFVEELTRAVLERGGSDASREIPGTLQSSLIARLDRLGAAKEAAQVASVIGHEFSYEVLSAITPMREDELQSSLRKLADAELIYARGIAPDASYTFKHALIRDAAYESLLKKKRREYHRKTAEVLQKRFTDTVEAQPELVANHFSEAGLIEEAVPYWMKAGQRAIERSANQEAIRHLTRGLELLKLLPESSERFRNELLLQICLGTALIATKGFSSPDVERVYSRARQLCQNAGEAPELFPVLSGLWMFYTSRGKHTAARDLAEHCLRIAQTVRETGLFVHAHQILGVGFISTGDFAQANQHLERALDKYDARQHRSLVYTYGQDPAAFVLTLVSWPLWFLGYPDQALRRCREAEALAQQLNHPYTSLSVAAFGTWLYQFTRNPQAVETLASQAISISTDHGFVFYRPYGLIMRGWALAERGQVSDGIAQMRAGLDEYCIAGGGSIKPSFLSLLAEAYGKIGQFKQALNILAEAQDLADENEERWWQAELHRIKGELILKRKVNPSSESSEARAEECFRQALSTAREQSSKSLELRAAVSISRLKLRQGQCYEARQVLVQIYNWFTEGFDTADLKDAKALLEELSNPP